MRKLLLATSALLGTSVGLVSLGQAGTLTPNAPNPAPGSITVTLNALVEAFIADGTDTGTLPRNAGNAKVATYGVADYARLYPSFDGVLANGIKYGGSIEIRQNQGFAGSGGVSTTGGASGTTYIQREFVYVGTDKAGKVSIGSPVQPTELFQEGNPANFNTGGWDGDLPGIFNTGIPYFITDSNDRANKVVYVSPQFAGFDFGVSFEPNDYGNDYAKPFTRESSAGYTSTTTVNPITGLSTTTYTTGAGLGNRRDTVDGAARYQGTFGAIGIKADVGGTFGGTVKNNTPLSTSAQYKNYLLETGGVSITFGGLEVDGLIDHGQFGPGLSTVQSGNTTAYVVGSSYTIGPIIFGASYYGFDSGYLKANGTASAPVGALHGYGIAAGGTYTLAPGASVFLEYLYGHQRATGYDLVNSAVGTTNNSTRAQGFGIGTAFKW
jgi:hypothetical protein